MESEPHSGVFGLAESDFEVKIWKFKIVAPIWRTKIRNFTWFTWKFVLRDFWGCTSRIWTLDSKIQHGGARMVDWNCEFYVKTHNQCATQPASTEFYLNQSVLFVFSCAIFVCRSKFLNFEFRLVISNVNDPWETRFIEISPCLHFRPPYWIREFEFMNFKFRFVICTLKNYRVHVFRVKNFPAIFVTFWRILSAHEGVKIRICQYP